MVKECLLGYPLLLTRSLDNLLKLLLVPWLFNFQVSLAVGGGRDKKSKERFLEINISEDSKWYRVTNIKSIEAPPSTVTLQLTQVREVYSRSHFHTKNWAYWNSHVVEIFVGADPAFSPPITPAGAVASELFFCVFPFFPKPTHGIMICNLQAWPIAKNLHRMDACESSKCFSCIAFVVCTAVLIPSSLLHYRRPHEICILNFVEISPQESFFYKTFHYSEFANAIWFLNPEFTNPSSVLWCSFFCFNDIFMLRFVDQLRKSDACT